MKHSFIFIIYLFLQGIFSSCSPDDYSSQVYKEGTNEYANEWMYQQMKKYYRWNETMPTQGNLSVPPKEYFSKLLQKDDVFSYALHPAMPDTAPQSLRRKFGFEITFVAFEGKYYGVILYVLEDSPAKNNGLKRGQLITQINGTDLNQGNYDNLYKNMIASAQLNLRIKSYSTQSGFSSSKDISLLSGFTFLQPITYQVIADKNIKIGYIQIPHFDVGQAQQFLQIFQELKNKAITELVLDLRYNGGGDISSATALSIALAPNVRASDLFITFEGNKNGGNVNHSFKQALESNESQISFEALQNAHPSINKVYVLCGNRTASASELIINNLKPYMDVVTIGEKTIGKDVAGFPIEDNRITGIKGWVLYPSIYKLFNANHEGNYSKGIEPSIYLSEIQELEVYNLGNRSEVLLSTALGLISGNAGKIKVAKLHLLPLSKIYNDADSMLRFTP